MIKSKQEKELSDVSRKARKVSKYYNLKDLESLLSSPKSEIRLFGLKIIRNQIISSRPVKSYFKMSKNLIEDSNNNCRWQSLIIIGEYLDKYPDDIFNIIIKYGSAEDEDMRTAIATILLEHLLENDFVKFFNRYKKEANQNIYLLDTLSKCWVNEIGSKEQKEIKRYLKNYTYYKT